MSSSNRLKDENEYYPKLDESDWDRIVVNINFESLKNLLVLINFELVNFNLYSESYGFINRIYLLKANDESGNLQELILRVTNPHALMGSGRTEYEAKAVQYIKDNTDIPVPKIYHYSNVSENSPIGCEYILMERLRGKLLLEALPKDPSKMPEVIYTQMIDIVRKLSHLDINKMNFISKNEDYLYNLNFSLKSIYCQFGLFSETKKIGERIEQIRAQLISFLINNKNGNILECDDVKTIHHGDLNSRNILVDPNTFTITGILDWEFMNYDYDNKIFDFFADWYDESHKSFIESMVNKHLESQEWYKEPKGRAVRSFFTNLISESRLVMHCPKYLDNSSQKLKENGYMKDYFKFHLEKLDDLIQQWPDILKKLSTS